MFRRLCTSRMESGALLLAWLSFALMLVVQPRAASALSIDINQFSLFLWSPAVNTAINGTSALQQDIIIGPNNLSGGPFSDFITQGFSVSVTNNLNASNLGTVSITVTNPTSTSTERRSRPTSRRRMQLRRSLQRSCFLAPVWASRESRDCAGGFAAPRRLPPHSNEQLSTVTFRRGARTNVLAPLVAVGLGFGADTRGPKSQSFPGGSKQAKALPKARRAHQGQKNTCSLNTFRNHRMEG